MTIETWLGISAKRLINIGIETGRLDALVLLEDVLGKDRAWLLAHPETQIVFSDANRLHALLDQRAKHVPLAYVRGKAEFYGHTFVVSPAVLQPRPESETMIDELLKLADLPPNPHIADVGTGSGALGITAQLELPKSVVTLLDIDSEALKIAKMNVDLFTLSVSVRQQDLLAGDTQDYDVLLCNLPYVPDDYQINEAAEHEPELALFGGKDGLDLYRQLFEQLAQRASKVLYILTEALPFQHQPLADVAQHNHYDLVRENDFIQVFRRAQKST